MSRNLILLVAVLVVSLSFGMGFIAGKDASPAPIVIEKCSE